MYKKILLVHFVLIFNLTLCEAQTITVRDLSSHSPLEFVSVYNKTGTVQVLTDMKGRADISAFPRQDSLVVRLLGFKTAYFDYNSLKESQFKIFMEPVVFSLDEAVISATKWKENTRDLPSKVSVINKRDMLLQNPQTAADLLATSGSVFVQKSQSGGGSPMIRGFATNRVLISVDGVRMNNAIFRSGNLQNVISIDPFAVETTEVLFGPGAVMYGSDAIGGAMNFYTISPQLSRKDKLFTKANVVLRHSTASDEKTGHFDVILGLKKWAFVTSASFSDFGHLKAGSKGPEEYLRPEYQKTVDGKDSVFINENPSKQIETGYSQFNVMQKIRFAPSELWDVNYGFHYSETSNVPRYDRLIEKNKIGKLRDGEWYYGPQKWMMNILNINYSGGNVLFNKANMTLAQQSFVESRHNRSFGSSKMNRRTENVDVLSLNIDLDKELGKNKRLFYGAEVIGNFVSSEAVLENIITSATSPLNTRYPDGSTWNSSALYLNYLDKISGKLTFQSGLRYNYIMLDAVFDTSLMPLPFTRTNTIMGALTGSAGLAYKPVEKLQLNFNLSTGFRAPNIDDIGKVFDSEPGAVIVPNPFLKSEYAYNGEAGITKIFGEIIKIDITAYYTLLSNALVRREFSLNGNDSVLYDGEMSRVLAIQNAANAYVGGVQAGVEVKLPYGLGVSCKFTYQKGEEELDDGSKAPLRHAAPWFGNFHLTYSKKKVRADFYAVYQSEVVYKNLAPSEKEKPHLYAADNEGNPYAPQWITLNLKLNYKLSDYLSLNAGVENITDKLYRPYSSGISAPGRNFVFSAVLSF